MVTQGSTWVLSRYFKDVAFLWSSTKPIGAIEIKLIDLVSSMLVIAKTDGNLGVPVPVLDLS